MSMADPSQQIVYVVRAHAKTNADRAVDWIKMGGFSGERAERYRRSRLKELLILREGERLTEFALSRVCSTFFWRKLQNSDMGRLNELAVRAGVVSITMPDGSIMRPTSAAKEDGQDVADADWFNTIGKKFGETTIGEMAGLVVRLGQVPEDAANPFGSSDGLDPEG